MATLGSGPGAAAESWPRWKRGLSPQRLFGGQDFSLRPNRCDGPAGGGRAPPAGCCEDGGWRAAFLKSPDFGKLLNLQAGVQYSHHRCCTGEGGVCSVYD